MYCICVSDDRFILKEMSRLEMQLFLGFAPNYFDYIQRCHTSRQPTLLGKIVGVYRIVYRNLTSNATLNSNLLVMENLFYSRSVTYKFDLKGSVRNRMVNPNAADNDGEIVLLDENLLNSKYLCVVEERQEMAGTDLLEHKKEGIGVVVRAAEVRTRKRLCSFKQINEPDASISQIYCSSFKYSSTRFRHPLAHYQELQQLQ